MKSMKKLVLAGLVLLASVMVLVGCKHEVEPQHEHSFADEWSTSDTHHWKAATCEHTDEVSGYAEHTFVNEVCSTCNYSRFVYIPEGSFQMGSNAGSDNNKPVHDVTISKGFFMGKYEVTQKEYLDVMGRWESTDTPSDTYGKGDKYPAYNVSWYDAVVYCNKRSIAEKLEPVYKKGDETDPDKWGDIPSSSNDEEWNNITCDWDANGYRLPTEAEWEYAARAGNDTTNTLIWSETDKKEELGNYAWYSSNSNKKTHKVGMKYPNAYDLFDMSGNVWEWCWDRFGDNYYGQAGSGSDPKGASSGVSRVYRGGGNLGSSWDACAVSYRDWHNPSLRSSGVGFRVVRTSSE